MRPNKIVTLCRICLNDGARFPIFEHRENNNNIYKKLCVCLNEKIEDVDGYPRHLCLQCKNKLNSICEFINKYKESSKILQYGVIVKEEKLLDNDYQDDTYNIFDSDNVSAPELEIETKTKVEPPDSDDQKCLIEFVKFSPKKKIKAKKPTKRRNRIQKPKALRKPRSTKVVERKATALATCMLEGHFLWNGEKWCSSKEAGDVKFTDPEAQKKERRHKVIVEKKKRLEKKEIHKGPHKKLCDLCGEVLKHKYSLERHMNHVHFPKKITCPQCPKMYDSEYNLGRHIRRVHNATKDFICAECGRGYAILSEMNAHINKVHKKNRDAPKREYACTLCDKKYACQKSATIHERSVHTGERPAACTVCESTFYHEDYLREHMRLHTGETPFKCPVCGRGYAQRCNMKSHIKQHRISELDSALMSKIRPNYLRLMKP